MRIPLAPLNKPTAIRYRWRQLRWEHPTAPVEWWLGFTLVWLGAHVLAFRVLPFEVQLHIMPDWVREIGIGLAFAVVGSAQMLLANARGWVLRGLVATCHAGMMAYLSAAYIDAGLIGRGVVGVTIPITLCQIWVARRAFGDGQAAHHATDRRRRGVD